MIPPSEKPEHRSVYDPPIDDLLSHPHEGSSPRAVVQTGGGNLRWNPEVSLGAVIQAAVVVVGLIIWGASSSSRSEQVQRDLVQLRTELSGQISELRSGMQSAVGELRTDVRAVPTRLDAVDRWMPSQEARVVGDESRLSAVERDLAVVRADLDRLGGAVNAPLTRRSR